MNATTISGYDLFSCVAWTDLVSAEHARQGVPGSALCVYPAADGPMVAYGPVESVDQVIAVLREKHRGGSWEWRDESDRLLDRGFSIPTAAMLLSMPAVRAKLEADLARR